MARNYVIYVGTLYCCSSSTMVVPLTEDIYMVKTYVVYVCKSSWHAAFIVLAASLLTEVE